MFFYFKLVSKHKNFVFFYYLWLSVCFKALNSCSILNGGCEHSCVDMGNNHYKCECRKNYKLKRDGRHCERE